MGAICICWWHMASVDHKGLKWTFSPCATFRDDAPIGGWVLMDIWDPEKRRSVWERFGGGEFKFKRIPVAVEKALYKKVKDVKDIEPWPGED